MATTIERPGEERHSPDIPSDILGLSRSRTCRSPCRCARCSVEVERYTLATGETAITGSPRLWKPWWFIFIVHATPDSTTWTESRIYAATVWSLIAFGVAILLIFTDRPLVLLVIGAALSAMVSGYRLAILGVSVLWFGYYSVRV